MNWIWSLNQNSCTGCGICVDVCQFEALIHPVQEAMPSSVPLACTGCMDCVEQCPFDAITVSR